MTNNKLLAALLDCDEEDIKYLSSFNDDLIIQVILDSGDSPTLAALWRRSVRLALKKSGINKAIVQYHFDYNESYIKTISNIDDEKLDTFFCLTGMKIEKVLAECA